MADSEHFNLAWNQFENCAGLTFKNLLSDEDFADVTLACEGEKQLTAHKVILSSCSPFFRKVLLKNKHQHPLLYLKGVKFTDLQLIVKFIYLGQIEIGRDNLPEFLAIAKELEVKGLMEANDGPTEEQEEIPMKDEDESIGTALEPQTEIRENGSDFDENTNDKLVVNDYDWGEEDCSYSGSRGSSVPPMDQDCVKPDFLLDMNKPSKTPEGKFPCIECGYKAQTTGNLKRHRLSKHSGERVPCNICGKDFASKDGLKVHHQNKHEGVMFRCQICNHEATTKSNLLRHMKVKHEQPARGKNNSSFDISGYGDKTANDSTASSDKMEYANETSQLQIEATPSNPIKAANFYME